MTAMRSLQRQLAGAGLCCLLSACGSHEPAYRFEASPRALPVESHGVAARDARVLVDPVSSGTIYVTDVEGTGANSRLLFRMSSDGGDTFDSPITVSTSTAPVSSHGENAPKLVQGGPLYAVWSGENGVFVARSTTWGSSFEAPARVSDGKKGGFSGYPSLAAQLGKGVYVVWIDSRETTLQQDSYSLRIASSMDAGATFSPSTRVALDVCPCCRPSVLIGEQGEVILFWRKIFAGPIHDMVAATSHDQGKTFSEPVRIAEDNWKIDGCPDSGIAVSRIGSRIYVAWLTEARPDHRGVFLSWSDDQGAHWAPSVSASQSVLDANYPSLDATEDGRVLLAFQGRDPAVASGWAPMGAFLVEIGADANLSEPIAIPSVGKPVSRPTIVSGTGGRVFIVWTAGGPESSQVVIERARRNQGIGALRRPS